MMRMSCSGSPATMANRVRWAWGAWEVSQSVACPVTELTSATMPQVSRGEGCERGVVRLEGDDAVGLGEGGVGGGRVAGLPLVDQVVGLALLLVADHHRARLQRLLGGGDGGQHVVVDLDELGGVDRGVGVGGDDGRHLLALVAHLVGGQHRLGVARQGRHPGQAVLGHELAGHHGHHALHLGRRGGVDRVDPGVGHRRAQDGHVEHAGQDDVVEVVALALDEPGVLVALDRVADAADLDGSELGRAGFGGGHAGTSWPLVAGAPAADRMALTMFM